MDRDISSKWKRINNNKGQKHIEETKGINKSVTPCSNIQDSRQPMLLSSDQKEKLTTGPVFLLEGKIQASDNTPKPTGSRDILENKQALAIDESNHPEAIGNKESMETPINKVEVSLESAKAKNEVIKMFPKFWQTPSFHQDSPLLIHGEHTPILQTQNQMVANLSHDLQDFLNEDVEAQYLDVGEHEDLNLLTEELIQVFNYDNNDECNEEQKEELMKRVLKLGGENYTFEDLRRDILLIEEEDQPKHTPQNLSKKTSSDQNKGAELVEDGKVVNFSIKIDRSIFTERILEGLGKEDKEEPGEMQHQSPDGDLPNINKLGIIMNREGIKNPKYDRTKAKRGRKSHKVLKEANGQAKEQQKIGQLLNSGKGKCLPKAS